VGLELGAAAKGYPYQGCVLERELGSNQTRAVRCAGLLLETQERQTEEKHFKLRRKFMT
jgi:hypothetical protein